MVRLENSVALKCTPQRAFDYLSDLGNEVEWNPDMGHVEKLTDGPVEVGTRWKAKWKSAPKPVEVEMVEHDRPRRWVAHNGGLLEVNFTGRIEPESEHGAHPGRPGRLTWPASRATIPHVPASGPVTEGMEGHNPAHAGL